MSQPSPTRSAARLRLIQMLITVLVLALGAAGVFGVLSESRRLMQIGNEQQGLPLTQLDTISQAMYRIQLAVAHAALDPTPTQVSQASQLVEANLTLVDASWAVYMGTTLAAAPEVQGLAPVFAAHRERFIREGVLPALTALKAGDVRAARRVVNDRMRSLRLPVEQGLSGLLALQGDQMRQAHAAAVVRHESLQTRAIGAILLMLGLAWGLGMWSLRSLGQMLTARSMARAGVRQGSAADQAATPAHQAGEEAHAGHRPEGWRGPERRGSNRARNVTRPAFGRAQQARAEQALDAETEAVPAPAKTGTTGGV